MFTEMMLKTAFACELCAHLTVQVRIHAPPPAQTRIHQLYSSAPFQCHQISAPAPAPLAAAFCERAWGMRRLCAADTLLLHCTITWRTCSRKPSSLTVVVLSSRRSLSVNAVSSTAKASLISNGSTAGRVSLVNTAYWRHLLMSVALLPVWGTPAAFNARDSCPTGSPEQ